MLREAIYKRKSTRKYQPDPLDEQTLQTIQTYFTKIQALYPDIKVAFNIVGKEDVKGTSLRGSSCLFSPHYIVALSENKKGHLVNIGFMLQQMDLYLSSIGLGGCWLGMAKPKEQSKDNMEFVIIFAFGKPNENPYRELADFKRKPLNKLSNTTDKRLEAIRLAPSAMNLQNYYFLTEDNTIHAYCTKTKLLPIKQLERMREIDIGIALAHLFMDNDGRFKFFEIEKPQEIKGHYYIGSVEIL